MRRMIDMVMVMIKMAQTKVVYLPILFDRFTLIMLIWSPFSRFDAGARFAGAVRLKKELAKKANSYIPRLRLPSAFIIAQRKPDLL